MRITEILTESQLEQLEEGPLGTIGSAIGKGVGGLAKGVGAVAGGIAGIGRAAKKGYEVGKATVAGDPVPDQPAPDSRVAPTAQPRTAPAAAQAPTAAAQAPTAAAQAPTAAAPAAPAPAPATVPSATDINKAGPANTVSAKPVQGAVAKQAMAKTAQALSGQTPDQAGQTLYAQVKSQINQLDKKGKQRLLQLLQKSISAPAPAAAPAAGPGSATAPAGPGGAPRTEPELNAPTAAGKKKAAPRKPAAPSQAEIDADRQRLMGPGSESVIKKYPALSETLATRIDQHKRKMFEVGIASGEISVFAK